MTSHESVHLSTRVEYGEAEPVVEQIVRVMPVLALRAHAGGATP